MLKHHGHEVDVVGNGRLAVNAVRTKSYTLCLMDLQMPGTEPYLSPCTNQL